MPRKVRKQPGSSGGAYSNRTDLTQPVAVATGLPYGERQALEAAQRQAPLPQQAGMPTPPTQQNPNIDPALVAAQQHAFTPVGLSNPTERPHEPIQHGLPTGPGAGPEVLQPAQGTSASLMQLAQQTGNPAIAAMASRAQRYGI